MRNLSKKTGLMAIAFVGLLGGSARASTMEVKVPFPFVVQGRTLPAGDYRLERDAMEPSVVLIRGEKGNREAMYVMTMPVTGHDFAADKAGVTFVRHESQYQLVDIWDFGRQGRESCGAWYPSQVFRWFMKFGERSWRVH